MNSTYVIHFRAMGCKMNVWLETGDDGEAILRNVPAWIEAIEAELSRFRPHSGLSQLNARSGQVVPASDTLMQAALAAKHAARITNGLYNPLVLPALISAGYDRSLEQMPAAVAALPAPPVHDWRELALDLKAQTIRLPKGAGLDLGGTAKGWTADTLADLLMAYGSCLVDVGGDMAARGRSWEVNIAEPGDDVANVLAVHIQDVAIATSGTDHRRWKRGDGTGHHIIDPRTGEPAVTDVVSATVIHPSATTAEAYTKAVLVLGSEEGLTWLSRQWHGAAMVVLENGTVISTSNFVPYIVQKEMYS